MSTSSRAPASRSDRVAQKSTLWGIFAGIIVAALIAVPLSAAVAFATHPDSRFLFESGSAASAGGYIAFWWVAAVFLASLPVLIGVGVSKLSGRTLVSLGGIVALFVIALVVLGQLSF
jgi:hypothetical protein